MTEPQRTQKNIYVLNKMFRLLNQLLVPGITFLMKQNISRHFLVPLEKISLLSHFKLFVKSKEFLTLFGQRQTSDSSSYSFCGLCHFYGPDGYLRGFDCRLVDFCFYHTFSVILHWTLGGSCYDWDLCLARFLPLPPPSASETSGHTGNASHIRGAMSTMPFLDFGFDAYFHWHLFTLMFGTEGLIAFSMYCPANLQESLLQRFETPISGFWLLPAAPWVLRGWGPHR